VVTGDIDRGGGDGINDGDDGRSREGDDVANVTETCKAGKDSTDGKDRGSSKDRRGAGKLLAR
jgi:hypothetical protein